MTQALGDWWITLSTGSISLAGLLFEFFIYLWTGSFWDYTYLFKLAKGFTGQGFNGAVLPCWWRGVIAVDLACSWWSNWVLSLVLHCLTQSF